MDVSPSPSDPQQKLALGIIILSVVALLVGIFNAFNLGDIGKPTNPETGSVDASVASLLVQRSHLKLIELVGPITMDAQDSGFFMNDTNAVAVRKALDEAAEDKSVKGVLLRIDSPGGTVGMSQELNAAVQRVSAKKPVVASLGDLAASGGYYTACAADKIVTNPGTLTASIGVIISSLNLKGLLTDKLGVKAVTIKSGKFKDILSPYRDQTPEETALIQKLINDSYQDFLGAVINGRTRYYKAAEQAEKNARIASIKAVADGRVVHGREAVSAGLADEVGDLHRAYQLLDQMAKERFGLKGKDKLPLENAYQTPTLMDMLGFGSSGDGAHARLPVPAATSAAINYKELMPLSMRYPNQLLWVLE